MKYVKIYALFSVVPNFTLFWGPKGQNGVFLSKFLDLTSDNAFHRKEAP